jgi:hypothetical protein
LKDGLSRPTGRLEIVGFLESVLPACPIRALLGIPCPGCGLTRALLLCFHGDFAASLDLHPLAPALLAQTIILFAAYSFLRAKSMEAAPLKSIMGWLPELNCFALVAVWIYRLSGS